MRIQDISARINDIKNNLETKKDRYMKCKYAHDSKKDNIKRKEVELDELADKIAVRGEAISVLNSMGDIFEQNSVRSKIEKIITTTVQTLFAEPNFQFRFVKKIKKNQQELYLETSKPNKTGDSFFQNIDCVPGGHSDIIDIIIRILILKSSKPHQRVLELDEPFKNISPRFRIKFFRFFKRLCEKFDIQLNLVSHEDEYINEIENVYRFTSNGMTTKTERVNEG